MSKMSADHCKFFVPRKKRYCKMLVKSGQEFCGEHQKPTDVSEIRNSEESGKMRIVCPLDPKHTVYVCNLNKHLKICNARQDHVEPYIQKDFNSGKSEVPSDANVDDSYQILSVFPKDQVKEVIEKVNRIFENNISISDKITSYPIVEKEMEKPEYGDKTKKHLKQASAILGLLEEYQMLQENSCFIEFGAGRGQLSCWIAEATEAMDEIKILLVERASPKHKRDNKLARTSDRIQRIRADIADLVLDKLDVLKKVHRITGITKHLCGEATDFTIRCLMNTEVYKEKVSGALLTFCCHHRCRWTPYTGKQFFQENNLGIDDFNIICGLSSWATCGSGYSREYRDKMKADGKEDMIEAEKDADYGLSRLQREEVGRKCKNIINWGRLKYLEQRSFKCSLHHYVEKNITLENVCIVATK